MLVLEVLCLVFFAMMALKPQWSVKSTVTGAKLEKARRTFRLCGLAGTVGCLLILASRFLFST
jgi:hypothetical protein